ncbi:protein of unknown function (plasmid) [Candidatus Methylocalor cossyra]|uniref:Uncharacterized protein n=1 Tax=Candidatus Methylocalor cossyra TaxID=3108543 RepID=A0ABP1CCT8_9GAMM
MIAARSVKIGRVPCIGIVELILWLKWQGEASYPAYQKDHHQGSERQKFPNLEPSIITPVQELYILHQKGSSVPFTEKNRLVELLPATIAVTTLRVTVSRTPVSVCPPNDVCTRHSRPSMLAEHCWPFVRIVALAHHCRRVLRRSETQSEDAASKAVQCHRDDDKWPAESRRHANRLGRP